jgi:hypothetical protein
MALADYFLRAKHWQIFLLLLVIPTTLEVVATGYIPTTIRTWKELGTGGLVYLGLMLIDGWLWAMGAFLNALQRYDVRMKLSFFRFALVFAPVYMVLFFPVDLLANLPPRLLCRCIYSQRSAFYLFYFVARSLVTVNKGKQVSLNDYAKPLILLCLFPIGVWSIQPRINQLYAPNRSEIAQRSHLVTRYTSIIDFKFPSTRLAKD